MSKTKNIHLVQSSPVLSLFQNGISSIFSIKDEYISCNSMPCFVPRLEVTLGFSGCSHTKLQYRPHTTPLTFIKFKYRIMCLQKEKKKSRQVQSKETCPYRYISITVHNNYKYQALPQLSKAWQVGNPIYTTHRNIIFIVNIDIVWCFV